MSSPAESTLTLSNCRRVMQVNSSKGDIPESHSYFSGKVDGSNNTLYIVYSSPDFGKADKGSKPGVIIDTTDLKPLGFNAQSVKAYDKNGLVLFEYPNFAGEGSNFTKSVGDVTFGRSFIVNAGVWEFSLSSGEPLVLEGKKQFGPGTQVTNLDCQIVSAKKIEE